MHFRSWSQNSQIYTYPSNQTPPPHKILGAASKMFKRRVVLNARLFLWHNISIFPSNSLYLFSNKRKFKPWNPLLDMSLGF